jgi:hypothetical protein
VLRLLSGCALLLLLLLLLRLSSRGVPLLLL